MPLPLAGKTWCTEGLIPQQTFFYIGKSMKKQSVFFKGILALLLVLGVLFTGCPTDVDDDVKGNGNGNGNGSDNNNDSLFTEKADGKLLVNSTSGDDLVLFYDTITSSRLLGGLPANASGHRIKLPSVGAGGEFVVIRAVKYSDYKGASASEIANLKVVDSAFAYSDPVNDTSADIGNPNLSGNAEIQFNNQTGSWIEVGRNSPNIEDRFYVLKPNSRSSVFVNPYKDGYTLYYTVHIPMKKSGQIIGVQRSYFEADTYDPQPGQPATVTIEATGQQAIIPFYREGYVRILNNYNRGYTFANGSTTLYSTLQVSTVASGKEQVFELLGGDGEGQNYAQLKLTAAQAQYNKDISSFKVKNGYAYTVEIDSNGDITISDGIKLDPEKEEIPW
jgi:hypothetical protein